MRFAICVLFLPALLWAQEGKFAPNELRHDQVLIVDEGSEYDSPHSQAIHLERGWNLVSWYVDIEKDQQSRSSTPAIKLSLDFISVSCYILT